MLDSIYTAISALFPFIWLIIAISMIAVAFLVSVLLLYLTGDVIKFKKAARSFLSQPSRANSIATAKRMPIKVRKLYKRALITQEKPSDVIGIDAALYGPYQMSIAPKTPLIVFFISFFAMAIAACGAFVSGTIAEGFIVLAVAAIAGFVFTIIMLALCGDFYKRTNRTFVEYVEALDRLVRDGDFDHITVEGLDEDSTIDLTATSSPESNFATQNSYSKDSLYAPQFKFTPEISEPVHNTAELEPTVVPSFSYGMAAANVAEPAFSVGVPITVDYGPSAASSTSRPSGYRASERKAVRPSQQKSIPKKEVEPIVDPIGQTASRQAPTSNLNATDDLIHKINRAIEDEAPLATLKELALRLQQERAKPANKTSEKQKKLSEIQIKLMRAMTGAMKR